MRKIWEVFPRLAAAVRNTHLEVGMTGSGHDFEHAARVGQCAFLVAEDEHTYSYNKLAGAAGLCHNADRILQKRLGIDRRKDVPEEEIRKLVVGWLENEHMFGERDRDFYYARFQESVINAVLKHGGENNESDSPVLIALMDADRLVNVELDLVIRCSQFQPDLPAVDFARLLNDPTATYRDPKSVLRDIVSSLEWETDPRFALRTPKAIEMGKARFAALHFFMDTLLGQINESGLIPYPFPPVP